MTNDVLQIRVDRSIKNSAIKVLDNMGLDMSTAIRMFLKKMISENTIPFEIKGESLTYNKKVKKIFTIDDLKKYRGICTDDYKNIDVDAFIKEGRRDRKLL